MKTIFGALALCGMAFALSGNAAGQEHPIMGTWELIGGYCRGNEDGIEEPAFSIRLVYGKASVTRISDYSKAVGKSNCSVHISTNYSRKGSQITQGPFLDIKSPNCPEVSQVMNRAVQLHEKGYKKSDVHEGQKRFMRFVEKLKKEQITYSFEIKSNYLIHYATNTYSSCPKSEIVEKYIRID